MFVATKAMMLAAKNAGDMPDESNAWAAVSAVLDELEKHYNSGWLIWSRKHGLWWRPFECGYTSDLFCAGRYAQEDATRITRGHILGDGTPSSVMVKAPSIARIGDALLLDDMQALVRQVERQAIEGGR